MRVWRVTGEPTQVDGNVDRIPDFDPRTRDHFWVVAPTFRIDVALLADKSHTPYLDQESIVYISPIFCWYCEEIYNQRLRYRGCKPVNMEAKES